MDHAPHLSVEEVLDLLPVERVEVEVHQLLGHLGLDVTSELDPQLVHGQLFRQAGLELCSGLFCTRNGHATKKKTHTRTRTRTHAHIRDRHANKTRHFFKSKACLEAMSTA